MKKVTIHYKDREGVRVQDFTVLIYDTRAAMNKAIVREVGGSGLKCYGADIHDSFEGATTFVPPSSSMKKKGHRGKAVIYFNRRDFDLRHIIHEFTHVILYMYPDVLLKAVAKKPYSKKVQGYHEDLAHGFHELVGSFCDWAQAEKLLK